MIGRQIIYNWSFSGINSMLENWLTVRDGMCQSVSPVTSVRDLRIYINSDLSMGTHVKCTVSRCFASLHQLRQIRHSVPTATLQMLVVALVHSWLDYGSSVLVSLPAYLLRQLQSVLNAAARLVYHLKARDHITDALISLHWLQAPERILYKMMFWHTKPCMEAHHATSVR